ncbi:MAG: hypothetical protein RPU34_07190 [Candidatus Sedimenticola sp. (ex Thyasira tokunagai)]
MKNNYLVIVLLVLLNGCAPAMHLHESGSRDAKNLAFVRQNFDEVELKIIDGREVPGYPQQDFYVLPGKHSITAKLNYNSYISSSVWVTKTSIYTKKTCFEVKAGRKYIVLGKPYRGSWELRIEEFNNDRAINFDCSK